jgi:outer membrane lipoprotein carrier protein
MRWNYTEPGNQLIISDGTTLSIYTEEDKQLIRTPAKELESDITYAFFAGTRNLLDDFSVEPGNSDYLFSSGQTLNALLLVPRQPHNQIRDVQVWFDENQLIRHLVIRDHFDSITELNFSNIRVNSLAPGDREELDRITTFPIPPGTEIISR